MKKKHIKHIFFTGGVVSSIGKGVTAASVALLLIRRGYNVAIQKLDPYLNVDPGTMSPYQHGEVFVTEDGIETDLDLGHYERFASIKCNKYSNFTAGKIYQTVLDKERKGTYLGNTIQVVPHITDEIKKVIKKLRKIPNIDIAITEIGGTVGDIESLPFLEAIRQLTLEIGKENCLFIHLTLVPYIKASGELKTKPSQQSVATLRKLGINPDFLVCRSEYSLNKELISKLSLFCNVYKNHVIEELDVKHSIYEIPLELKKQKIDVNSLKALGLKERSIDISDWREMVKKFISYKENRCVDIAIVGKYTSLSDSYKSINEALTHAGLHNKVQVKFKYLDSEKLLSQKEIEKKLKSVHGILVPGGFGNRGIEGKINAIGYARKNNIPFLGICLGMQCAAIEFARNVVQIKNAHSKEFYSKNKSFIIDLMKEQKKLSHLGATMRLGSYPCHITKGTKAFEAYKKALIHERHRHRYEFNNYYKTQLEKKGLVFSGIFKEKNLVEIIELKDHKWFLACQFHPEFQSTPLNPHPIFISFIKKAKE